MSIFLYVYNLDLQVSLYVNVHHMHGNYLESWWRSVGKMGSKTRAGPGILKLKTGFSDIT